LAAIGARVYVGDIDATAAAACAKRVNEELGQALAMPVTLDVTRRTTLQEFAQEIASSPIDVLVNNAAIDAKVGEDALANAERVENFTQSQWDREIAVGLTGAFNCAQVFGSIMAEHGKGVILNIASDLSVIAPDQRLYRREGVPETQQSVKPVTYSVVKTGLIGLTRYLAAYWANKGVRVNALSPGGVYTNQPGEFVSRLASLIPMGRMAERNEYRGAVQFLCSGASSYMTGQNIVMDGGRSVI
jgi:NAD(P)-dependent dehydrogenase (short-subunit alcohol dehydrogenase family)